MKKLVIFDLDGTLTNTLKSIQKTANDSLEELGLPTFELDDYRYFVGDGTEELIRRLLARISDADRKIADEKYGKDKLFQTLLNTYLDKFEQFCNFEVNPYDGILELIKELKSRDILLAVNSNKPQNRSVDVVEEKFGKNTFDIIVGQVDYRPRKPAPNGVNYILETLNIEKKDALYLGDTSVDMKTGKSAGVFTVGALWGFRDYEELASNHADAIIEVPKDLLKYL